MELRNLVIFFGLALLALTQCSEARHSMHRDRRSTDYDDSDVFAADEASEDEPQNDELGGDHTTPEPTKSLPEVSVKIVTEPKVYEVKRGGDISLECQIEPANVSDVVMQWSKENVPYFMNHLKLATSDDLLLQLKRYSVADDSKNLNIKAVELSDAGVYRCEVLQTIPIVVEHTLVVLASPEIVRFNATNDGQVVEGDELMLTCESIGKPPPKILWSRALHDANNRLTEKDANFSSNSMYIKDVKREHSGKYYCYVLNDLGHDIREIEVTVTGKPHVHVHKTVINSAVGVEAVLECSVRYEANPHIRWYKDGNQIEDSSTDYVIASRGSNSNLTVTPKSDADFGVFTCEAENRHGKHNRSIELVQRPVVENLQALDGRLTWTVHSHRPLQEIQAQITSLEREPKLFDIPLPSTTSHVYELNLDLNNQQLEAGQYEARVKVKSDNSYWSDDVDPVLVEIDVQPSMSIQHASVFRSNGHSVTPATVLLSTFLMYLLVRTL